MPRVRCPSIHNVRCVLANSILGVLDELQALTVADGYDAVSGQ